jgi:hypothetical protein
MLDGLSDAQMCGAGVLLVQIGQKRLSQAGRHDRLKEQNFSRRLVKRPS